MCLGVCMLIVFASRLRRVVADKLVCRYRLVWCVIFR